MIYFDNAATTFPKPENVYKCLEKSMKKYAFNSGRGVYEASEETSKKIEEARLCIAKISGTKASQVTFLASATDAINCIILGLGLKKGDNVYISPFEHNAIVRPLNLLKEKCGINLHIIKFNDDWTLDEEGLKNSFAIYKPKLVFVSHISNVTGFLLPYDEIFQISRKYNSINCLDAAQSFGVVEIKKDDIDFVVFDGHKSLYSFFGVGGFVNYSNKELSITISGGTGSDSLNPFMPEGTNGGRYEAGTHNSLSIIPLIEGCAFLQTNKVEQKILELSKYFIEEANKLEKIHIYLPTNYISYGIVSFSVDGYLSSDVGQILSNEYEICVRSGYHCAPLVHNFIKSMDSQGTVRVSFSFFNNKNEINRIIEALGSL